MSELIVGFFPEDKKRIEGHLQKLLPHLDVSKITVVGGIAIRYHLSRLGVPFEERPCNDIDLVSTDLKAIKSSAAKDFHISHYHPNKKGFYVVLVDENTKTKADIFSEEQYSVQKRDTVNFSGHKVGIRSLEDQLATSLLELSRALKGHTVYKQNLDFVKLMMTVADMDKTTKFIRAKPGSEHDTEDRNISATQLFELIVKHLSKSPKQLKDKLDKKREPYVCKECIAEKNFPITSMEKIYETLGYSK